MLSTAVGRKKRLLAGPTLLHTPVPSATTGRNGGAVLTAPFTTVTWARLPAINARASTVETATVYLGALLRSHASWPWVPPLLSWVVLVCCRADARGARGESSLLTTVLSNPALSQGVSRGARREARHWALCLASRAAPPGRSPGWRGVAHDPPEGGCVLVCMYKFNNAPRSPVTVTHTFTARAACIPALTVCA